MRQKSAVRHNIKDLEMEKAATFAAPVSRVFISLIFIMFGLNKLFNYGATAGWMEAMGVPSFLLPFVIILEVFGGDRYHYRLANPLDCFGIGRFQHSICSNFS